MIQAADFVQFLLKMHLEKLHIRMLIARWQTSGANTNIFSC